MPISNPMGPVAMTGPFPVKPHAVEGSALSHPEAEQALIGAMLTKPDIVDAIADMMTSGDFSVGFLGRCFDHIVELTAQKRRVSSVVLLPYVQEDPEFEHVGGRKFLANLTASAHLAHDAFEGARILIDLSGRRQMIAGLQNGIAAASNINVSLEEAIAITDAAIEPHAASAAEPVTFAEAFADACKSYEKGTTGCMSGCIKELDELLGALAPGSLTILAARPGMGKTAVAATYGLGAARSGAGVLFASIEMANEQLVERIAADFTFDDPANRLAYGDITKRSLSKDGLVRYRKVGIELGDLPLHLADKGIEKISSLNRTIRRTMRRMAAAGQTLKLVIVDYLQLMHPETPSRSNYETVSEISRCLKAMAKEHDVAIMALAQLSRSVEQRADKTPQLSDLRDSGQIEQDADSVLFLLRDEYYLKAIEPPTGSPERADWQARFDRAVGNIDFILAKQRHGTTGRRTGKFYSKFQAVR